MSEIMGNARADATGTWCALIRRDGEHENTLSASRLRRREIRHRIPGGGRVVNLAILPPVTLLTIWMVIRLRRGKS